MQRRWIIKAASAALISALSGVGCRESSSAESGKYDQTLELLAQKLEKYYVSPEVGAQYARMLRSNLEVGAYAALDTVPQITERVTQDLQVIAPDLHLEVLPLRGKIRPLDAGPPPPQVEEPEWVRPGVARIKINSFSGDQMALAVIGKFLNDYADAETLIFDLRDNHGGGPDEMTLILPYLFGTETQVLYADHNQAHFDDNGAVFPDDGKPWLSVVPGPPGVHRTVHIAIPHATEARLFDAEVFVLVSGETVSSAEAFAFGLQCTGRGKVVGERTAGGGHFAQPTRLDDDLSVSLPVGVALCPKTELGWERVGVDPDIPIAAGNALEEALEHIGQ